MVTKNSKVFKHDDFEMHYSERFVTADAKKKLFMEWVIDITFVYPDNTQKSLSVPKKNASAISKIIKQKASDDAVMMMPEMEHKMKEQKFIKQSLTISRITLILILLGKEKDMEISIEGVVEVNYHLVIDEDVFNECCEEAGLDPANFKKFSKAQWDELNPHLIQAVVDNVADIDYTEIHEESTVYADTLTIDDSDKMTTVYYEQDRKVGSVEILQERNGGVKFPTELKL